MDSMMKWFIGVCYDQMIAVPEICVTSDEEAASVYSSRLTHGDGALKRNTVKCGKAANPKEQVHWRTRDRYAGTLFLGWVVHFQLRYILASTLVFDVTFVSPLSLAQAQPSNSVSSSVTEIVIVDTLWSSMPFQLLVRVSYALRGSDLQARRIDCMPLRARN